MTVTTSTREQHELVRAHMGLARALARAALRRAPTLGISELQAVAFEALLRAARRYVPARGVPFHCFAFERVRGALVRACQKERRAWLERLLRAEADSRPHMSEATVTPESADDGADGPGLGPAFAGLATPQSARTRVVTWAHETAASAAFAAISASPETLFAKAEGRARAFAVLDAAIRELGAEERRFVALYYESGATLEESARELGVSKRTVQRLQDRVKASIALALCKHGVSELPSGA